MEVDPISSTWSPLPPPPDHHLLLFRHPSISRHLPIKTVYAAGKLVLLAATDRHLLPALPSPSLFDPNTTQWIPAPALSFSPRRCCAAGSAGGALYVESGVGSEYSSETARSTERRNSGKFFFILFSKEFSLSGTDPYYKACSRSCTIPNASSAINLWVLLIFCIRSCFLYSSLIPTNRPSLIEYRAHPFGAKSTAPLMNTTNRYVVAAVRKWRLLCEEYKALLFQ